MVDVSRSVEIFFQLQDQTTVQAKKIAESLTQVGSTTSKLTVEMKKLESTMASIASFRKLKKESSDLNAQWKTAESAVRKLAQEIKASGGATKQQNVAFRKAVAEASRLKKAFDGSRVALNGMRKGLTAAGINTKKLSDEQNRLSKQLRKTKNHANLLAKEVPKAGKAMKKSFQGLDAQLIGISASLVAIGAALIGPFALGISKATDFQDAMLAVKGISGATADEFERLTAVALKMGRETRYTSIEAAEGLKFMSMAGLDASQQIAALPSVLRLAQAGALDLGRAADIATNIMTGFGFAAEDLVEVNDVLVQAFTNSNSTLEELATSLVYVGPLAKGLGAEFNELVATLGNMHNAGIKGSMAGTSLRNVLDTLFNPTKDEAEQMEELSKRIGGAGLQIKDSEGKFVGFVKVMQQLEAAGITTQEALKLFGQRAGPGIAALLLQGSGALQDMTDKMDNADGVAKHIADTMESGLGGATRRMKSAIDGLLISLGQGFIPVLTLVKNAVSSVVVSMTEFREALGPIAVAIDFVISAVGGLIAITGALGLAYSLIVAPLAKMIIGMATAQGATVGLGTAFGILATKIAVATGAMIAFFATTPVGWFILGTAAILGMAAAWKSEAEKAQEALDVREVAMSKMNEEIRVLSELSGALGELEEGTEKHAKKALQLRDAYVKAGEGTTRLADAAKEAAESINEVTGEIEDGGKAIADFGAISAIAELQDLGDKGRMLGQILQASGKLGEKSFTELYDAAEKFKKDGLGPLDKATADTFDKLRSNATSAIAKMKEMNIIDLSSTREEVLALAEKYLSVGENVALVSEEVTLLLRDMGLINLDSTKEEIAAVAEKYLSVGENAGLAKDAVLAAFDDMTTKAQKKTDDLAKAIQESFKKPLVEGLSTAEEELENGMIEIAGYFRDFHGDLHSNAEIFGEDYVQIYNVMFQNLNASQRKGFMEYFRIHQMQANTIHKSTLDEAEKIKLLEESKARFIYQAETRLSAQLARERVDDFSHRIDLINRETATNILNIQQRASKEKKAAHEVSLEVIAAEMEKYIRLLAAANDYVDDMALIHGEETKLYKSAVKKQQKAANELKNYKIQAAQEASNAIVKEIEKAADAEQRSKDKIKGYENDIFDLKLGLADKLRSLKRKDFEKERAERDKYLQAQTRFAEAQKAYWRGDIERAQKLASQAEGFYTGLKDTQRVQEGIKKTVGLQIKLTEELATKEKEKGDAAAQKQKDLNKLLQTITKTQDEIADKFLKIYDKQKDPFNITVLLDDDEAKTAIDNLKEPTFSTHTITVKTITPPTSKVEGNAKGGVAGMSGGGKLLGFGTRDVIPALLTYGERILNATSTRILDKVFPGMMPAANQIKSADQAKDWMGINALRKFAAGGLVNYQPRVAAPVLASGVAEARGNLGRLEIIVGGNTFPVLAQPNVARELEATLKRETLMRSQ